MTKMIKVAGLALALLVLPSVAQAQLQLGARLGYAIPGGSIDKGESYSSFTSSQVPLQVDVGYRFEQFSLAVYFAYAPGQTGSFIDGQCAGITCSTYGMMYGVSGIWNFAPKAGMQPWIGARLGSEYLQFKFEGGGASTTLTTSAFDIGFQGGLDFALGPITLGPYLSYDTAKFSKITLEGGGSSASQSIPSDQQTWHNWFAIGAKAGITF
jgi:hypothetical protein